MLAAAGVKAGLSSLDPKTLAPSISPQAKAQQSDIARLTRSPAGNYKSTTAPQGSRSKKSRAGSTSKSVRFSLGVSVPEDNITAGAAAAAHELEPSCLDAQDSSVSDKMQPAAEASSKKTRSGKILGTGCATDRQPPAQPVPSPGSLVQQEVLPNTGRIRTTRSGRTFDAQPEPSTRSNTASVLSKRDHAVGSALVASARAAGTSSNSPATASASGNSPAPVRTSVNSPHPVGASSNSLATEPGPSQAAPAGSAGDRLCHPWKSSLLGVGSPLPQHDTLSDRGRPPITDHPCHKRKSASMTRR